jgi:hypothetical protein
MMLNSGWHCGVCDLVEPLQVKFRGGGTQSNGYTRCSHNNTVFFEHAYFPVHTL